MLKDCYLVMHLTIHIHTCANTIASGRLGRRAEFDTALSSSRWEDQQVAPPVAGPALWYSLL